MDDMISRKAAIGLIRSLYPSAPIMRRNRERWEEKYKPYIEAEKALEQLPSAEPERKRGRWIFTKYYTWECSECGESPTKGTGYTQSSDELYAFCPHCGSYNGGEN